MMSKPILCKVGWHPWIYKDLPLKNGYYIGRIRFCRKCGKKQQSDGRGSEGDLFWIDYD